MSPRTAVLRLSPAEDPCPYFCGTSPQSMKPVGIFFAVLPDLESGCTHPASTRHISSRACNEAGTLSSRLTPPELVNDVPDLTGIDDKWLKLLSRMREAGDRFPAERSPELPSVASRRSLSSLPVLRFRLQRVRARPSTANVLLRRGNAAITGRPASLGPRPPSSECSLQRD